MLNLPVYVPISTLEVLFYTMVPMTFNTQLGHLSKSIQIKLITERLSHNYDDYQNLNWNILTSSNSQSWQSATLDY